MRRPPDSDFYADPCIYDILHTPGTAAEVDGLQRIAALWVNTPTNDRMWLEPACGTGRYLRVLCRRGVRAVGFDTSPDMIGYARRRLERLGVAAQARLFEADMTDFAQHIGPGRVDFAFNPINTIRHLDSDQAMLQHFADVARVLKPGGVYAVGIGLSRYGHDRPDRDVWTGVRGCCRVEEVVRYRPPTGRRESERYQFVGHDLVIHRPSGTERRSSSYRLRCYDEGQWTRLLERSALERVQSVDERGRVLDDTAWIYQIELLRPRRDH